MLYSKTIVAAAMALLLAGPAAATTFSYSVSNPGGNHAAGRLIQLDASYDDVTHAFTWTSVFEAENGMLPDGGWLVVSNGPNPKNNVDEYAILYLDGALGRVTTYVYSGQNNANSFQTTAYLATHDGALSVSDAGSQRTLTIDLVATLENAFLNTPDWDGIQFGTGLQGPEIGYWYHPTKNTRISYDPDGRITGFSGTSGWYDKAYKPVDVPEPHVLGLLGLAGLGVLARRRA
ncbi:MAG: PEP-CTERM sorting domain-containing protein [Myxococcota bacterium]|nr:PEP-CTERM sorting domain-containing protein [Myxococcota bacterium]